MKRKLIVIFILALLLSVSSAFSVVSHVSDLKDDADTVHEYFSGKTVSFADASVAYERMYQEFYADSDEYIVNKSSGVFHRPGKSCTSNMKEENKVIVTCSLRLLLDLGFKPCSQCDPDRR